MVRKSGENKITLSGPRRLTECDVGRFLIGENKMKYLNCINCDTVNFVDDIAESFKCGECGEINPGIDLDILYSDYVHLNKMYSELADRLRVRDREVERLTRLLIENNISHEVD